MTEVKLQPDPHREGHLLALTFGGIPDAAIAGTAMRVPAGMARVGRDLVDELLLPIQRGVHAIGETVDIAGGLQVRLVEGAPEGRVWLEPSPEGVDEEAWLSTLAREAIGGFTEPRQVPGDTGGLVPLAEYGLSLPDADEALRVACAELIRRGGDLPRAAEVLATIPADSPAAVDAKLVQAQMDGTRADDRSRARSAIFEILAGDDLGTRGLAQVGAAHALIPLARARHLDHVLAVAVTHVDERVRDVLVGALEQLDRTDVVAGLMLALTDADAGRRAAATQLLGCFPGEDTRAATLTRLGDEAAEVRYQAAVVLAHGDTGNRDDYAALITATSDEAANVRTAALQALESWIETGDVAAPSSVCDALVARLLTDDHAENRARAAMGLRALAERAVRAVAALAARLDDDSEQVRGAAADALAAAGDTAALPFLRRRLAAETSEDVRIYLEDAITELEDAMPPEVDPDSIESVDALLDSDDGEDDDPIV